MSKPDPASLSKIKNPISCPYCEARDFIKKGKRKKKYETIQVYFCRKCERKFTPLITKRRSYPVKVILDGLTLYNRFYSLNEASGILNDTYGLKVKEQNISSWLKEFKSYLPFLKIRDKLAAGYDTRKAFIQTRLFHKQIYDFCFHFAKTDWLMEAFPSYTPFDPLKNYLEQVPRDCPHKLFRESASRCSRKRNIFDLEGVRIYSVKQNAAINSARFALQAVGNNRMRHEKLQEFMLVNDSVTIAVEVPILITFQDLEYFREECGFTIPSSLEEDGTITGHIDLIQLRGGLIHILDYKPNARREKPIEQLTIYALALSRLAGLRLYHFKCAWFDDENYYEFYPLRVVSKKK